MNLPVATVRREPAQGGLLRKNFSALAGALGRKAATPPGTDAGWHSYGTGSSMLSLKIAEYMDTYGGEEGVSWIYACATLVMDEMALYPYNFVDPTTASDLSKAAAIEYRKVPSDLRDLVKQPNRFMTWFDFINYKQMDEELVGNSYWLKDQRNAFGQPLQLLRMRPEYTRIAVDKTGAIIGYAYRVQGIDIPFDADEVIHFKLPSPHSEYYGMGRVQGIAREAGVEIATGKHVVGFFQNGARISGVLTIAGTLPDPQFDRLKQQFKEEYGGTENDFSVLIAEQGTRFDPVTQAPADSGVVSLRTMSQDAILSAFGVHKDMLGGMSGGGGLATGRTEAQVIFTRKMRPRARRTSERLTSDLTGLWGKYGVYIDTTEVTEFEVRVSRARDMLGAGATLNEARIELGYQPFTDEFFPGEDPELYRLANTPILPSGYEAFFVNQQGTRPGAYDQILPGGSNGNISGTGEPTAPAGSPDRVRQRALPITAGRMISQIYGRTKSPAGKNGGVHGIRALDGKQLLALPSGNLVAVPDGYEDLGNIDLQAASNQDAERLIALQATIYREEVPDFENEMVGFFNEQRGRVLRAMGTFGTQHDERRLGKVNKKQLVEIDRIFSDELENDELASLYRARATGIAQRTVNEIADMFATAPAEIRGIVEEIGAKIVGVNQTTRDRIAKQIAEGVRRGYSVQQIAAGVPDENYLGIQGVFDSATESRALTIARTETATIYNLSALSGFEQIGVVRVEVLDGEHDEACKQARGQIWSVTYARSHALEHPNCIRQFVPILAGTGRSDYGPRTKRMRLPGKSGGFTFVLTEEECEPHGIMCMDCEKPLNPGDTAYARQSETDGDVYEIVCVECGEAS